MKGYDDTFASLFFCSSEKKNQQSPILLDKLITSKKEIGNKILTVSDIYEHSTKLANGTSFIVRNKM